MGCGRWWGASGGGRAAGRAGVIARGLSPLQESSAVLLPPSPRELPLNSEAKGLAGIFFFSYQDNKQGLSYSKGVLKGGEINSFLIPVLGGQSWKCYLPYPVTYSIALLAQSRHRDVDFPILRGYVQLVATRGGEGQKPASHTRQRFILVLARVLVFSFTRSTKTYFFIFSSQICDICDIF